MAGSGGHAVSFVKHGLGLGVMQSDIGDAEPAVTRVPGLAEIPVPMWLTTHREVHTSRRVRVVFDYLFEGLRTGEPPALD